MPDDTKTSDAIVGFDDAERWVYELYPLPARALIGRLLGLEPAVVAVAVNLADRLERRLIAAGVDEREARRGGDHVTRACLICAEMTRRGYRKFIAGDAGEQTSSNEEIHHG
jgi:hypothetical protein